VIAEVISPLLCIAWIGQTAAPLSAADPTDDGYDNIFGLITPDEQQEIWTSGQRNCVTLDQASENSPPVGSDDVVALIETYRHGDRERRRGQGQDLGDS
jgi:hypothetical protein